ncbi:MAG TPA: HBL/NHE enterotoxin family protein [Bryobacteraceae bacterium]|jgi:hypothetical protein
MLAPDVSSGKSAISAFAAAFNTTTSYGIALISAQLGPFNVAGTQVDLLAPFPMLKANIETARQHANTFLDQNLLLMTLIGLANFNSTFQKTAASILETVSSGGSNQQVSQDLQTLLAALQTQQDSAQSAKAALVTFNDQLSGDEENVNGGEQPISSAIDGVQKWVLDESEAVGAGPGGSGLIATIAEVGSQMTTGLNAVLSSLESIVATNESAGAGIDALLVMWGTLIAKYQDVIDEIAKASGGAPILAPGDVRAAEAAWSELAAYAVTLV